MESNSLIIPIFVFVIAGLGFFLAKKIKELENLQKRLEEINREKIEAERNNWERWQAASFEQMQNLAHSMQSQLNQVQGNVGLQVQKMLEQMSNTTYQLSGQMQKQMANMTQSLDKRLSRNTESIDKITQTHLKLIEETKGIQSVGKDIAELQRILKAPKLRGILGELSLENLLSQIYPRDGFVLQYPFKNGVIADAVLKLKDDRLLVIDSKFAHSKFAEIIKCEDEEKRKRLRKEFSSDVKKHILSISEKYILPDEKTLDFALMYIPAENVYYDVIIKYQPDEQSILEYAYKHKVFPVSPNTLYAYLTTIAMGLRGLEVNKKAQKIIDYLGRLSKEYFKFRKDFEVLGSHINKTHSKYEDSSRRLARLGNKMEQVQSLRGKADKKLEPETETEKNKDRDNSVSQNVLFEEEKREQN